VSPAAVNAVILRDPYHRGLAKHGTFDGNWSEPLLSADFYHLIKSCRGCGHEVSELKRGFCSYRCTWKFPIRHPVRGPAS